MTSFFCLVTILFLSVMVEAELTDDDGEYLQVIKHHYQSCLSSNDMRQVKSGKVNRKVYLYETIPLGFVTQAR